MIEIRQTEVYAQWFDSMRDRQARVRLMPVSAACHWATQGMSHQLAKASRNYGSTTVPAIGCILCGTGTRWWFYSPAVTSAPKTETSERR